MPLADRNIITDEQRLNALRAYCLLDTPADPAFDRMTRLASRILNVPVALVSLVDTDRQFFKSQIGLTPPLSETRELPLSHSFCQHVVATTAPLIIEDARQHPLVYDNLAIIDYNVIAYAGIPLMSSSGHVLGSFCVIDYQPRRWTPEEISILSDLAASVMTEVELRAEIRERQLVEAALRESKSRYRSVVNVMQEGVMVHDQAGKLHTGNPAAESILGLLLNASGEDISREITWHTIDEHGEPLPPDQHPWTRTLQTGEAQLDVLMGVYRPDGELRWIIANAQPLMLKDHNLPYATVTTFVDVTERRAAAEQTLQLEVQKRQAQFLRQFIADSSHEFRTPLSIIQSSLYLLNKAKDDEQRQQKVNKIEMQLQRLVRLIDMLQEMSQLDIQDNLDRTSTNINCLLAEIIAYYAMHPQRCITHFDTHLPELLINADSMHNALSQIIDNAFNFTRPEGTITIDTHRHNDRAVITVTDDGMGIPESELPHIFERFYRLDKARTTSGFGLGLPIAQTIIEQHGGHIKVESQNGAGTTFTICLPLQTVPDEHL
ncbi:MAG: ATP-binding protein [Anaerolineae bacterium]